MIANVLHILNYFNRTVLILAFSLAAFPSISIIFPFWHCPKKKEKTLGKNQPPSPLIHPFPRDSCLPSGGLSGLRTD